MKPQCELYDQDLLMLVHRQLGPWRTLVARVHVRRCPACRARLQRLEGLSLSLASGLRNPRLGALALRPALRNGLAGVGLLAVLLSLLGWLASADAAAANPERPRNAAVSTVPTLCRHALKKTGAAANLPKPSRD